MAPFSAVLFPRGCNVLKIMIEFKNRKSCLWNRHTSGDLFCAEERQSTKSKAEKRKSTRFSVLTRKHTQTNFWECFGTEKKIS